MFDAAGVLPLSHGNSSRRRCGNNTRGRRDANKEPRRGAVVRTIVSLFNTLPGDVALKIFAPSVECKPPLQALLNSSRKLFVASANKTFVLCEALRQADAPDVDVVLEETKLALDSTVWSFGSPIFNPPHLSGTVSERTALEAMITRSDNTATDMTFKLLKANSVRRFIAAAHLNNTLIPDSTRAFAGYVFGASNYLTLTWEQLVQIVQGPLVHPFFNSVQTLASSADDLVSYYLPALEGEFFQHAATLNEFRRILTLCDFIYRVPLPLGVSAYAKSGDADSPRTLKTASCRLVVRKKPIFGFPLTTWRRWNNCKRHH